MTLANQITLLRAALAVAMFVCILLPGFAAKFMALLLFGLAALTDWLDGKIARQTGTSTPFGAIADPFVDKILIGAAFIGFASVRELNVPHWAVFLILARELMISSLRVLAALGGKVLAAETMGKFKTVCQLLAALAILLIFTIQTAAVTGPFAAQCAAIAPLTARIPYILTVFVTLITWISGISYLKNHWTLLQNSWSVPQNKTNPQAKP